MRFLYSVLILLLAGCTGSGGLQTTVGSIQQQQNTLTAEWEAYYMAISEQIKPTQLVRIELDDTGRVAAMVVNQAPPEIEIKQPKKYYSAGWETANRFVDGLWKTAQAAVPVAGGVGIAYVVADNMAKIAPSNTTNTNSYNQAGEDYAGADHIATTDSYNPVDNSNQNNPVDNSLVDSDNPTDNSNQNNPIDNSNQDNPVDNSNQDNPIDNSNQNSEME